MKTHTLMNDFHSTEVYIRLADGQTMTSHYQALHIDRELCGIFGCGCGSVRGPQDDLYVYSDQVNGQKVYVTEEMEATE